ncbi:hypothetical protein [Bacillus cereus]|uniref:hypothetical protein n=1 Tax=Bacillus cereus TaxID=1396 RepID=UPI0015D511AD|nr:hypothetical protein [Bacillus cereus]
MFGVIGRNSKNLYTVYGVRVNEEGLTEFLMFDGKMWHWDDASDYLPANSSTL